MKALKIGFFCCCFLNFMGSMSAQSKKEIKSNHIRSITESVTATEAGKTLSWKEQYTEYDKNGNVIERTEFNKDGSVKKKETALFDKSGNKLQETSAEAKQTKEASPEKEKEAKYVKKTYKYNVNNDKVEEIEYNETGKMIKKTAMNYNSAGNKTLEVEYDASGKIVSKILYTYNNKGLKVDRKEYEGEVMQKEKKYDYQYF